MLVASKYGESTELNLISTLASSSDWLESSVISTLSDAPQWGTSGNQYFSQIPRNRVFKRKQLLSQTYRSGIINAFQPFTYGVRHAPGYQGST